MNQRRLSILCLNLLLSTSIGATEMESAPITMSDEDNVEQGNTPPPSRFRTNLELSLPSNSFALKGLNPDLSTEAQVANLSFTPAFSPELRAAIEYDTYEIISYAQKLGTDQSYQALTMGFPIDSHLYMGVFYRKFEGFDEQLSFETNNAQSSNISYDSSLPSNKRSDITFLDLGIFLKQFVDVAVPIEKVQGFEGSFDLKFYYGIKHQFQNLNSAQSMIPESFHDQFGEDKNLKGFSQNILGPVGGIYLKYSYPKSFYVFDVSAFPQWQHSKMSYLDSSKQSTQNSVGTSINFTLGYGIEQKHHRFETSLQFDGHMNKVENLGFSSIYLALQLKYSAIFF